MINEPIYIIGTGAIGKALAVFLTRENKHVVLIRGSIDDEVSQMENLTIELPGNVVLEASVEVTTLSNKDSLQGLIILANKSFGNHQIAEKLKSKAGHSPIVVMQNGLNVEQPFVALGFKNIYRCVLFATSQSMSTDRVRFKPVSTSLIGAIKGDGSDLRAIIDMLDNSNFHFQGVGDIQPIIWKKAIANCVFNSICPLLEIDNGIFHRNEAARTIGERVIEECVAIAKELGVAVNAKEVAETVQLISRSSDGQLISTLQDIKHKRDTEIESLNFAIVKLAADMQKEHLVPETKLLGELTKLKSQLNR